MIIVSGPDNSGKTTLVQHLVKEMGLTNLAKCQYLPLWLHHKEYAAWVVDTLKNSTKFDIVDRCYIDELVYGPIMRGCVCFKSLEKYVIDRELAHVKPLIIITNPGDSKILESYGDREQYPKYQQNIRVRNRYYQIINEEPFNECPHYIFDYRFDPDYKKVEIIVQSYINKEEQK
jgi:GTPase SAR1 family protein